MAQVVDRSAEHEERWMKVVTKQIPSTGTTAKQKVIHLTRVGASEFRTAPRGTATGMPDWGRSTMLGRQTTLAAEQALSRLWDTPEEDEAWADL